MEWDFFKTYFIRFYRFFVYPLTLVVTLIFYPVRKFCCASSEDDDEVSCKIKEKCYFECNYHRYRELALEWLIIIRDLRVLCCMAKTTYFWILSYIIIQLLSTHTHPCTTDSSVGNLFLQASDSFALRWHEQIEK